MYQNNPSIVRRWGIRMDGCGVALEDLIKQHFGIRPIERPYTLIEIGSAGCTTLRAFRDILADARGMDGTHPWRVFGFDLPEDKAWSLDWPEINRAFNGAPHILREGVRGQEGTYAVCQMYLWLLADPRTFLQDQFSLPISFAFIDGCHGKCAGRDFCAIERKIEEGGLVVFHDFGLLEQGSDWQGHCREFISVRSYVHRLGLAAPCVTPRKGWRFVGEIPGSRTWGKDGNSCAIVQRTAEPLEEQPELSLD